MKKIGLLLAAALIALSVMGCANPHTSADWDILTPPCFNSSQGNLTINYVKGSGTALGTVEFTFDSSNTSWGAGHTADVEFGICSDTSWTTKYTGAKALVLGADYVKLTQGSGDNNKVTGLVNGKTYVVSVKTDASSVSVKIAEK